MPNFACCMLLRTRSTARTGRHLLR